MGGVLDRARATSLIGRSLIREDAGVACCDGPDVIVCDAGDTPRTSKSNLRIISWAALILGVIYSVTGLYGAMERL